MRFKLHLLLFSLVFSTWVHAQDDLASIDLVAFNSSINYGAGSGITVHFNPRGVFKFEDEEDAAMITSSFWSCLIPTEIFLEQHLKRLMDFL